MNYLFQKDLLRLRSDLGFSFAIYDCRLIDFPGMINLLPVFHGRRLSSLVTLCKLDGRSD